MKDCEKIDIIARYMESINESLIQIYDGIESLLDNMAYITEKLIDGIDDIDNDSEDYDMRDKPKRGMKEKSKQERENKKHSDMAQDRKLIDSLVRKKCMK